MSRLASEPSKPRQPAATQTFPPEVWAKVPACVLGDRRLSSNAVRVYGAVATFGGCESIYPSVATLAERSGLGPRTVQKGLRALERFGYLDVIAGGGRRRPNRYLLLGISKLRQSCGVSAPENNAVCELQTTPDVQETMPVVQQNYANRAGKIDKRNRKEQERGGRAKVSSPPRANAQQDEAWSYAFTTFKDRHGQDPYWTKGDRAALRGLFRCKSDLTVQEFKRRWTNYLKSTETFTVSKGFSLKYFCLVFDRFMLGPAWCT